MANETGHVSGRQFEGRDGKRNSFGSAGSAYAANGAILDTEGSAVITKVTAATMTLAAPIAGDDDFKQLTILSISASAHTVTNTSPGFNNGGAGSDVATFGAAIGNSLDLVAYQGVWYVSSTPVGVTLG
jgi:hypothetical protein